MAYVKEGFLSESKVPDSVKLLLWGKSAGRCQYRGCNAQIGIDSLTKSDFNAAYVAHIVADKPNGPRGDKVLSPKLNKSLSNVMLMCDSHHRLIDKIDVAGHPASLLNEMKKEHEERVLLQTMSGMEGKTHLILYGANVGEHTSGITFHDCRVALDTHRFPAEASAIEIGLMNSATTDRDPTFWEKEVTNLEANFKSKVLPRLASGEIKKASVFARAPQPLLTKLGQLLGELYHIEVYQSHRNPTTWKWQSDKPSLNYKVINSPVKKNQVALVFELSATVTDDRVYHVLGADTAIWKITIDNPNNDHIKSRADLANFRQIVHTTLDKIKSENSGLEEIHVFQVMAVSEAVELGRAWMPKADLPLVLYDEVRATGGFVKSIKIQS